MDLTNFWRSPVQGISAIFSFLLNIVIVSILLNSMQPGQRDRQSNKAIQTTFYVGLGQARGALPSAIKTNSPQSAPSGIDVTRAGSGVLGTPAAVSRSKHHGQDTHDEDLSNFLPPAELDISALQVSEPDYDMLNGLANSHLPVQLRLFIDRHGKLVGIHTLQVDSRDSDAATRIGAMFFITKFLPGRRGGKDMPSFIDIEINIDNSTTVLPLRPS